MRFLLILFILLSVNAFAQTTLPGECGLSQSDAAAIREQMFRNRNTIPVSQIQSIQQQRFNIHIPVVVHIVGNSNGQGFAGPQGVINMICRMNEDFADQNLRFYLKDSLRFVKDDTIFMDAYDSIAVDRMIALKDTTALNIFTNGSAGGGVAGYYSRRGDYVFILNSYANGGSTTITHELGHFFTLMHTFYGWEGTDARVLYNNVPAPDSINDSHGGKKEVEYVARTGPLANCYSSADGFCDTPADYISEREQCPMPGIALDPSGTAISPSTGLYMSYFYDACVDSFSSEQKTAIMASVVNRNWLFFPAPNTDSLDWNAISAISPLNAAIVPLQGQSSVILQWNSQNVGPATSFIVTVERMLFGSPIQTVMTKLVNAQNFAELPTSVLINGGNYRWAVMPFSKGYHCAGFSPFSNFSTETVSGIRDISNTEMTIMTRPNPVKSSTASIYFNISEPMSSSIRVYSADGRLMLNEAMQQCEAGEHYRYFDVSSFASGYYIVQLLTEKGNKSTVLIIE
jgi:hypothetical protein